MRMFSLKLLPFCFGFLLVSALVSASDMERIQIRGDSQMAQSIAEKPTHYAAPDPGELLKELSGAAINRNGPLTPIAQYRGLYGDRVAVSIAGSPVVGAGPNAMDAPLSYVPMALLNELSVSRGIAPVSAGIETLGGAYQVNLRPIEFSQQNTWQIHGNGRLGYQNNGQARAAQGVVEVANSDHAVQAALDIQQGRDEPTAGNQQTISPSTYERMMSSITYQQALPKGDWSIHWQHVDTDLSGTPALPMDITFVKTDRVKFTSHLELADWQTKILVGYGNAAHLMDNFSLRSNGESSAAMRQNNADSEDLHWLIKASRTHAGETLELGFDGVWANHDSVITNPSNSSFNVVNFRKVDDQKSSVYLSWQQHTGAVRLKSGARLKHISADADEVSHSMSGSNAMIAKLVNDFNQTERHQTDWLMDITAELFWSPFPQWSTSLGLARKQRAPSYQERYLWLPMESTGGLADGMTYMGDANLNAETALQLDWGVRWQTETAFVEPHFFYQQIDDYIQGTPSTNQTANKVASMMSGNTPLQFANLEAELYGVDIEALWQINAQWQLQANASATRGKRRDIQDNLYRIAPPTLRSRLSYQMNHWHWSTSWQLIAKQEQVSATNQEKSTSGYGVFAMGLGYQWQNWHLNATLDNLFNRYYQDHLTGYNRVKDADIPVGERLPGLGRHLSISVSVEM